MPPRPPHYFNFYALTKKKRRVRICFSCCGRFSLFSSHSHSPEHFFWECGVAILRNPRGCFWFDSLRLSVRLSRKIEWRSGGLCLFLDLLTLSVDSSWCLFRPMYLPSMWTLLMVPIFIWLCVLICYSYFHILFGFLAFAFVWLLRKRRERKEMGFEIFIFFSPMFFLLRFC